MNLAEYQFPQKKYLNIFILKKENILKYKNNLIF